MSVVYSIHKFSCSWKFKFNGLILYLIYFFLHTSISKSYCSFIGICKIQCIIFFCFYLFYKKIKLSLIFIIINLAAVILYHYYLDISDPLKAFDPFFSVFDKVNQQIDAGDVGINYGLFNLHNLMIDLNVSDFYYMLFTIITLIFCYFILFKNSISKNKLLIITCLITSAIIYHGLFDFVILIPVLAYVIKYRSNLKYNLIYFLSIINIFYFYKINTLFNYLISKEIYSTFGMMLLILSIILLIFLKKMYNN